MVNNFIKFIDNEDNVGYYLLDNIIHVCFRKDKHSEYVAIDLVNGECITTRNKETIKNLKGIVGAV